MGIFRVEKVKDYTTISNYHLRDKNLSLKAKGLLTLILALPEDWNFTIRGLSAICKEGAESIGTALKELEKGGYLVRKRVRGADGRMSDTEYNFWTIRHGRTGDGNIGSGATAYGKAGCGKLGTIKYPYIQNVFTQYP